MTTTLHTPAESGTLERLVQAPPARRPMELQPATWDAEARTIEVCWTTGARGARFDWATGEEIEEELATGPGNVRLDRLNAGAPVLDTHARHNLAAQIGVVVPGSARMQGGRGIALVRLSDRPELASIVADIVAGTIRNLSVGYRVHIYEIERRPGQPALYRATDWEPVEISFVPVPFDAGAQVRSGGDGGTPCRLRGASQEHDMEDDENETGAGITTREATPARSTPKKRRYRAATPQQTMTWLREAESLGGAVLTRARELLELNDRDEISIETIGSELLKAAGEHQRLRTVGVFAAAPDMGHSTFDNPQFHSRSIGDAIYARLSGRTPTDSAREFMHMSLVDMAGDMLARAGHRDVRRMSAVQILDAASWNQRGGGAGNWMASRGGGMHTTSDFPQLLQGAGERYLIEVFAAMGSPIKQVARKRTAGDFRPLTGIQLSGFGTLPKVVESGEIKHGTFSERANSYRVETFAKIFGLTRQAIINDDLGAFGDPLRLMARAAAETEASILAGLINDNPDMSDGTALFHSDHGNLAGSGAAPDVTTLGTARLAIRKQMDLDGVTPLNLAPRYILTGAERETAIEALLTTTTIPTSTSDANPFAGKLTPLVDPRLAAAPWYLFADPAAAPVIEYAYLSGYEGPQLETKDGWDTLGTQFRVVLDFGAGLVDHRGAYKNPGA